MNRNEAVCNAPATAVFFARCPPLVTEAELLSVFSEYGEVVDVNLFRRWPAAKVSKGCGIVQFTAHAAAVAALEALNGKFMFKDSEAPMVVEWVDVRMLSNRTAGGSRRSLSSRSNATVLHSTNNSSLSSASSAGSAAHQLPQQSHPPMQNALAQRQLPVVGGAVYPMPIQIAQQQQASLFGMQLSHNSSSNSVGGAFAVIDDATHWMGTVDSSVAGQMPAHVSPVASPMQGLAAGGTVPGAVAAGVCSGSVAPLGSAVPGLVLPTLPIQMQQRPAGLLQQTNSANVSNIHTDSNLAPSWTVQNLGVGTGTSSVALLNGYATQLVDNSMASNLSGSQMAMNGSVKGSGFAGGTCGTSAHAQANSSSMSGYSQVLYSGGPSSSSCLGTRYTGEFSGPFQFPDGMKSSRVAPPAAVRQVVHMPQMLEQPVQLQPQQVVGVADLEPAASTTVLPVLDALNPCVATSVTPIVAAGGPMYSAQGVASSQQGCMEVIVPVTPAEAPAVTGRLEAVMELSGAGVSFNANSQGLNVKITGSIAQVQTACQLLGYGKSC